MPLHASSSWHLSITYMPSTPCSPSLSHAYLSPYAQRSYPMPIPHYLHIVHHMHSMPIPHYLHTYTICFPYLNYAFL